MSTTLLGLFITTLAVGAATGSPLYTSDFSVAEPRPVVTWASPSQYYDVAAKRAPVAGATEVERMILRLMAVEEAQNGGVGGSGGDFARALVRELEEAKQRRSAAVRRREQQREQQQQVEETVGPVAMGLRRRQEKKDPQEHIPLSQE